MAIDFPGARIRVNSLCPTFIEKPMTKPFFKNEAFRLDVLSRIKLGRLGLVEDLMGAIVFLASDASSLMTGSSLVIDGAGPPIDRSRLSSRFASFGRLQGAAGFADNRP